MRLLDSYVIKLCLFRLLNHLYTPYSYVNLLLLVTNLKHFHYQVLQVQNYFPLFYLFMSAQKAVWANLSVGIPIGIVFILLFSIFRTRFARFYHRNVMVAGRSLVRIPSGFFAWFSWLWQVPDGEYLALTGLDGYSAVATLHLLLFLTLCFALLGCLILAPYYYWYSDHTEVSFASFSIVSLYEQTFWLPVLMQLLMTALTLYLLYHFCSNFVPLRQAYLMQPSCMSSLSRVLKISDALGSIERGRFNLDAGTRTVLLHPISGTIDVQKLHGILEESGVKGVARVQKVGLDGPVMAALNSRNRTLAKLEACLKGIYEKLKSDCKDTKGDADSKSKDTSKNDTDKLPPIKETTELLRSLLMDEDYLKSLRPRHKTSKPAKNSNVAEDGTVDSIAHFHAKLMERERALVIAIEAYDQETPTETVKEVIEEPAEESIKIENDPVKEDERFEEETSFISVKKLLSFKHLGSTDKTQQWAALIHFNTAEEANRTHQLLLSAQLNEMLLRPAPSPAIIIAANLNTTAWERYSGAAIANFLFFLFILAFAPITTAFVQFMELKDLSRWFPRLNEFTRDRPTLIAVIEGVIAPYIVLRLIKASPIFISLILSYRRPESQVQAEKRLQRYTLLFYIFQLLLVTAYFSSTYQLYATLATGGGIRGFFKYLQEITPQKAYSFFNYFTIQAAIECCMELLNPFSMFLQRHSVFNCYRKKQPIRALLQADSTPIEGSVGVAYSRYIIYPFFVVMVYAVISPLVLLSGLLYYSTAFIVYKQRMLYMVRGPSETGGEFWRQACPQLLNALLLGQLSLMLQMGVYQRSYPGLFVMLLTVLVTQFWAKGFFERTFGGKAWKTGSMVEGERAVIAGMVQKYLEEQNQQQLMKEAVEGMHCGPIIASELKLDEFDNEDIDNSSNDEPRKDEDNTSKDENESSKDTSSKDNASKDQKLIDTQVIKPYWYLCPLGPLLMPSADSSTFDPFHADHLVETRWASKPYSHPGMMAHSQVLMMPRKLPQLLAQKQIEKREASIMP